MDKTSPRSVSRAYARNALLFKPHSSCGIGGHGASISLVFSLNRVAHIFPGLYVSTQPGRDLATQDTPSNSNVFSSPQGFQINFSKVSKESERGPKYVDVLPFTHQVGITRPNILLFRLLFEVDFGETRDGAEEQLLWVELQTAQFYADDNFFRSLSFRFNNTVHVS